MSTCALGLPCQSADSAESSFDAELLAQLLGLPHKILSHHEHAGLAPLILHELGHDSAFKFKKASYLVNNPDFDCVRGFAGYCTDDCCHHDSDMWGSVDASASNLQQAPFHKHTAEFCGKSLAHNPDGSLNQDELKTLCGTLGIDNPSILTWKMRHGNHGILLFEADDLDRARRQDLLNHFVPMLSLC